MITALEPNEVFCFGSNQQGFHGAGAALIAQRRFGAIHGRGEGHNGQSYAIPTRTYTGSELTTMGLCDIAVAVNTFLSYAKTHLDLTFLVTEIGCGYAGLTVADIAPMFKDAPDNVRLPRRFIDQIELDRVVDDS